MSRPLARFGVLTDIQTASNIGIRQNHSKTEFRYYENSLLLATKASKWFQSSDVDFCVHLGDLIDLANTEPAIDDCAGALERTLSALRQNQSTWHFLIGNHELYTFSRPLLLKELANPIFPQLPIKRLSHYYSFSPCDRVLIIILDSYDISRNGCRTREEWQQYRAQRAAKASAHALYQQEIESIDALTDSLLDMDEKNKRYANNLLDRLNPNENKSAFLFSNFRWLVLCELC